MKQHPNLTYEEIWLIAQALKWYQEDCEKNALRLEQLRIRYEQEHYKFKECPMYMTWDSLKKAKDEYVNFRAGCDWDGRASACRILHKRFEGLRNGRRFRSEDSTTWNLRHEFGK